MRPEAAIAPTSWAMKYRMNLSGLITPTSKRAMLIAGLKTPPVIRKKIQAVMRRLKDMDAAMYMTLT
jgi:hypothetical protein